MLSTRGRSNHGTRAQSLVEFALVIPVLLLIVGAIIQFGVIFWAQNTLTQVARDVGRWEATQQTSPCDSGGNAFVAKADAIAQSASLIGYRPGLWSTSTLYTFGTSPEPREGVEVGWPISTDPPGGFANTDCPPTTNQIAWFVNIRVHHVVPLFFPVIGAFIPSCTATDCTLSSTVQFRMEPAQ